MKVQGPEPTSAALVPLQPPLAFEPALEWVQAKTGFDLAEIEFRLGVGRGHLLELLAVVPVSASQKVRLLSKEGQGDKGLRVAVRELVKQLLGSVLFERWVGTIRCELRSVRRALRVSDAASSPLAKVGSAKTAMLSAGDLLGRVLETERDIHEGLGQERWCDRTDLGWTLLESEGEPAAERWPDLILAVTAYPELLRCYLLGAPFDSCRFSATGEKFAYLKLAFGASVKEAQTLKDAFESGLDSLLRAEKLGAVIASGLGTRHLYWGFALSEVGAGALLLEKACAPLLLDAVRVAGVSSPHPSADALRLAFMDEE